ncbi:hypothetical protein T440DRAFT_468492 [Plenodomus tracheiphilus IPT5]|uniref:Uncharacterized protein n=1 Tax=Plenodomus tracheiphilus IPT5 TaxID=1408161 RepID=A0A6A7B4Q9_9PLEO|nr:hypothetical protein T440DRAFT_468492 [Plenodomus tracheiphilus IPT5]
MVVVMVMVDGGWWYICTFLLGLWGIGLVGFHGKGAMEVWECRNCAWDYLEHSRIVVAGKPV